MFARVLCLSIIGHGLVLLAVIEAYRLEVAPYIGAPPWPGRHRLVDDPMESTSERPLFGEPRGTGLSLANADLPMLLQARAADVQQPFLSLDPVGNALPGVEPGDADDSDRTAIALFDALPDALSDARSESLARSELLPGGAILRPLAPHRPARVVEPSEIAGTEPASDDPSNGSSSASADSEAEHARARRDTMRFSRGDDARPADIAPSSDRVMDGFARVESAVMSPGGAVARQGRLIRFPRPVWTLGSYADVWSGTGLPIRFVIEMQLDESGAVRSARLLQGTGRPSIDRPVLVAAHGARLDPSRDEAGQPRADVIAFVLTVR